MAKLKRYIPKDDAESKSIAAERKGLIDAVWAAKSPAERAAARDRLDDHDEKYWDVDGEGTSWRGET